MKDRIPVYCFNIERGSGPPEVCGARILGNHSNSIMLNHPDRIVQDPEANAPRVFYCEPNNFTYTRQTRLQCDGTPPQVDNNLDYCEQLHRACFLFPAFLCDSLLRTFQCLSTIHDIGANTHRPMPVFDRSTCRPIADMIRARFCPWSSWVLNCSNCEGLPPLEPSRGEYLIIYTRVRPQLRPWMVSP